jgi:hypothetical protein
MARDYFDWNSKCMELSGPSVMTAELWKFRPRRLKMTCTTASYAPAINAAVLPARVDEYWETQNRLVWNESECAIEAQELIYEVTWVPELGAWRRFLKSRRKVQQ